MIHFAVKNAEPEWKILEEHWETQFARLIYVCPAQPDGIFAGPGCSFMPTQCPYQLCASAYHIILSLTAHCTRACSIYFSCQWHLSLPQNTGLSNFQEWLQSPPNLEQVFEPLLCCAAEGSYIFHYRWRQILVLGMTICQWVCSPGL